MVCPHNSSRYSEPTPPIDGRRKTILFISGCPGVTYEHRVVQAARACETLGFETTVYEARRDGEYDADSILQAAHQVRTVAVVCHRVQVSPSLRRIVQGCCSAQVARIYDSDDLIFDPECARLFERLGWGAREQLEEQVSAAARAIRLFDRAWCSTPEIGRGLSKLGISQVFMVPNTFSMSALAASDAARRCRAKLEPARSEVVIGFGSGSRTHAIDLANVGKPLARILKDFALARLCLVGDEPVPQELLAYRDRIDCFPRVPYADLPGVLSRWDINIAPLERTRFTNAKSGLKYIDAALVEVPTVATETEPFADAIQDGVTGRLVTSGRQWYQALTELVVNRNYRRNLGRSARMDVVRRFGPSAKRDAIETALGDVSREVAMYECNVKGQVA